MIEASVVAVEALRLSVLWVRFFSIRRVSGSKAELGMECL